MNVCLCLYTGMLWEDIAGIKRKCVWRGLVLGECVFVGQGVCMEGVQADSGIPFALVSVGLDQV